MQCGTLDPGAAVFAGAVQRAGRALGRFHYDAHAVEFEDRMLAHLQMVMVAKLRRGEPFVFTWSGPTAGRTAVWINPAATIAFTFDDPAPPHINRAWIDALVLAANSPSGVHPLPEPEPGDRTEHTDAGSDGLVPPTPIQ